MNVTIIGTGWLGKPLAKALRAHRYQVCASRQSEAGVSELESEGITGFLLQLPDAPTTKDTEQLAQKLAIQQSDVVIGAFPPGFRRNPDSCYDKQWQLICDAAVRTGVKKLIMISATSVYPDKPTLMTEAHASAALSKDNPDFSDKARLILAAEQAVLDSGLEYTIIRASGLFGPGRHPARFAAKLPTVSRAAPANMLHLDDAVAITEFAIEHLHNQVVNATSPKTTDKASFYQTALHRAGSTQPLPPVTDTPDKRICVNKLLCAGYQFIHPNCSEAL